VSNDADIIELLSFRHKPILAGDLKAKHPFWNSVVSNLSGRKLLNLLHINEFEISAPQCSTHYSPVGNGDMLDTVVHKNVRLSEVIVCDILDSNRLPIVFHLLDHIRTRILSDPIDRWEWWNACAKEYTSRGATSFRPVPNIVQYRYINDTPRNTWCLSRSLCWWHLYICDKPQRGLCSQKAAAKCQCYWDVVWDLEHRNQWK
jgi:hypothetical protein